MEIVPDVAVSAHVQVTFFAVFKHFLVTTKTFLSCFGLFERLFDNTSHWSNSKNKVLLVTHGAYLNHFVCISKLKYKEISET